jgi:hypothetical protein
LDFVDEYAVKRNQKYQEALRILTNWFLYQITAISQS